MALAVNVLVVVVLVVEVVEDVLVVLVINAPTVVDPSTLPFAVPFVVVLTCVRSGSPKRAK